MPIDDNNLVITSYAQNREDIILAAYFHDVKKGFYIDIGANHPVVDSVTNMFYEQGWSGINVEPLPEMFKELDRLRTRDVNVRAIVGMGKGYTTLHIYHTPGEFNGLSTASQNQEKVIDEQDREDIRSKEDIKVKVMPLKDIIAEKTPANQKIHFLKIDVEGLEYEVLNSNDWSTYRPEVICIEADHVFKNWSNYLKSNGYKLDFFDGVNEYYVENKSARSLAKVYADQVLKKTYVSLSARMFFQEQQSKLIEVLASERESLEKEKKHQRNKLKILEEQVSSLELELGKRRNIIVHLLSGIGELSNIIDRKIETLNKPKWKYPAIKPTNEIKGTDGLISVAHQADSVFSSKPYVPFHRKALYLLLMIPFRLIRKTARVLHRISIKIYRKTRKDTV